MARADRGLEHLRRGPGQFCDGRDPGALEPLLGLRPDPGDQACRALADNLEEALPGQRAETVGLVEIGRDLGDEAIGAEADRRSPFCLAWPFPSFCTI